MINFRRILTDRKGPLRALLAFALLVFSSLQPGMFAGADETGFHAEAAVVLNDLEPIQKSKSHDHRHVATSQDSHGGNPDHRDGSGKNCEVHCAPCQAVPVDCPDIERVVARCFAPIVATALPLGEYAALIRPPRRLI